MTPEAGSTHSYLRPQPSWLSYASSIHSAHNPPRRSSTPVATHLRAEVYTAVDPYEASISHSINNLHSREDADSSLEDVDIPEQYSVHQLSMFTTSVATDLDQTKRFTASDYALAFVIDTLPRLAYSYVLLRLPSLYFSRVARVFEDADLTMPEIKRMALELANARSEDVHQAVFTNLSHKAPATSPFWTLKSNWESFIDSLLREWKTLNIISVLLLSAILTIFQIDSAANDPLTRYSALCSLICALMSLLYGCVFIIRFASMKKPHKAAEWAWEGRRMRTTIWWNVWVMLAMPAVWLAWSVTAFIVSIMSFVWRTGSTLDGTISPLQPHVAFWPRLVVSLILGLGVLYFLLITTTLRQYGSKMDRKWRERVKGWTDRIIFERPFVEHMDPIAHISHWRAMSQTSASRRDSDDSYMDRVIPHRFVTRSPSPMESSHEQGRRPHAPAVAVNEKDKPPSPIETLKAMELWFQNVQIFSLPEDLMARSVTSESWAAFTTDIENNWNDPSSLIPQASVLEAIAKWNASVFSQLFLEAVLCREYYPEWPESPVHAIYITDRQPVLGRALPMEERFGDVPFGLIRIDVLDFSNMLDPWLSLFPPRGTEVHFDFASQSSPPSPEQPIQWRPRAVSLSGPSVTGMIEDGDETLAQAGNRNDHNQDDATIGSKISDIERIPSTTNSPIRTPLQRPVTPFLNASPSREQDLTDTDD
ncbi:hypothetical protein NP233_g9650 [Leucocoprinus birnbaumii]|uniref:Uncharacterized protein n=1 Tax=Leucocoprinus birnbaumii TaxID=56174 RepID=A0AAD5VKE8_9AGAR|nr:hypothetical protein NP233_g9650 [Leucocoprinus birnbaumii]